MRFLAVSLVVVGAVAGSTAAFAYGAKPANPSGFGQTAKTEVPLGSLASEAATNDDGPGASNEVGEARGFTGSTPSLPPATP